MFNMVMVGQDRKNVAKAVNQGIDARLEGFTRSQFDDDGHRLHCQVDEAELPILVRRLADSGNDEAELLADDIVQVGFLNEDESVGW